MSMPLEHDYIGLSESFPSSMENGSSENKTSKNGVVASLNLKATELRLGLPGRDSPERDGGPSPGGLLLKTTLAVSSGAKRGFSDAIDNRKWVFSDGSEDHLFSPRALKNGNSTTAAAAAATSNNKPPAGSVDAVPPESPKPALHTATKPTQSSAPPASKSQVVGWPPIRASRKNLMGPGPPAAKSDEEAAAGAGCLYVKVSMDGAPYLRKIDLKVYGTYTDLSSALEKMFSCFTIGQCGSNGLSKSRLMDLLHGSEFVLTYEDKDGDWMLVGDVPWPMFTESCKRMRIMKSSDAIGLAPRTMEKFRNCN